MRRKVILFFNFSYVAVHNNKNITIHRLGSRNFTPKSRKVLRHCRFKITFAFSLYESIIIPTSARSVISKIQSEFFCILKRKWMVFASVNNYLQITKILNIKKVFGELSIEHWRHACLATCM